MCIYIYIYIGLTRDKGAVVGSAEGDSGTIELHVSLYKIWLHFKALLWESILRPLPPPTCNTYPGAIVLDARCAIYAPPPTLPVYAIHHTISVMAILCKGQAACSRGECSQHLFVRRARLNGGLYTILSLPILYGV